MKFIEMFNDIYKKTFALRDEISAITCEKSGEEYFYELDYAIHNSRVREKILDYLTEIEDFFFLVTGHKSVKKSFELLTSRAFFERLSAFYGFILYYRKVTHNNLLFLNYERVLSQIGRLEKNITPLALLSNKYYVGIRASDCATDCRSFICNNDRKDEDFYFQGCIAMFAEDSGPSVFPVRPNQNKPNKHMAPYLQDRIRQTIAQSTDCRFVFYNDIMAYQLPPDLASRFICMNSREVLQYLNDKAEMKQWLASHDIPIVPYETYLGQEITLHALMERFPAAEHYIIQNKTGGGGIGTYLVSVDNFAVIKENLMPLQQYLVSSYIEKSLSVNTHVFISDKQTVLSPGSVQIVSCIRNQLCYRGADYIAFRHIPEESQTQIKNLSITIANRLRELGYRGVAGIDYLVTDCKDVYCVEINPRFQASTVLLDLYLAEQRDSCKEKAGLHHPAYSTFELNEQGFENRMMTPLCFEDEIQYSCYYYYKENVSLTDLISKREQLLSEGAIIHNDGFEKYNEDGLVDENSYLFRAVFSHAICEVSPDMTLWINDNIPVYPAPVDLMDLKIALLNQGVRYLPSDGNTKVGVYESIDLTFCGMPYCENPVVMNCAVGVNLSQYSPYTIEQEEDQSVLMYYGRVLGKVELERDQLKSLPYIDRKILYIATDRLRIKLVSGCEYKNLGCGCQFCNLPLSERRFSRLEIQEALLHLKNLDLSFRHILIGGGTCTAPDAWDDVIWLCRFLKNDEFYYNKPISLMSILPPKEKLPEFMDAGLEEVSFNIEISDDDLAKRMMPGKRSHGKEAYYSLLKNSVGVFGIGSVRSALLVGLDREDALVHEVIQIAEMGVIPCLSAFRALPGSACAFKLQPDNAYLRKIYDKCTESLSKLGGSITELGPQCRACRNNMLAI